jgi:orotate phosphoribosyltransferase
VDPRARLQALIAEKCILRGDFTLASGQKSSVYFDCKRATLDPEGLHLLGILLLELIDRLEKDDGRRIDAIGGPTIGADPVVGHVAGASWTRHLVGAGAGGPGAGHPSAGHPVRAFLVRKATKDHGTGRLIENDIPKGSRVLVFEDVVTTAKSTLEAIATMEQAGLDIAAIAAVVDREQGGAEALVPRRFLPLFRKSEFGL